MITVSALFDTYEQATRAVSDLETAGFPSDSISIVSNKGDEYSSETVSAEESNAGSGAGTGAGLGAVVGGAGGLLAGLGLLAIPGVGPVVAAGWLAATLAGAVGGAVVGGAAGGIVGALTSSGVSEEDAHAYAEGIRRGGTLVTARVDDNRADEAEAILARHNRVDLIDRRTEYRESGWQRFDDTAEPYVAPVAPRPKAGAPSAKVVDLKPKAPAAKKPAVKKAAAKPAAKPAKKPDVKDDISLIGGIGPVLKDKMTKAGYPTLSSISKLTKSQIASLDDKLALGGRIEREEWVEQAKELLAGKPPRAKIDQ